MTKVDLSPNFLQNTLFALFLLFPLSLVLRSFTTNLTILLISLIVIFFTLKRYNSFYLKDDLIKYLVIFLYIFFNSLLNFNNIEISIKSLGNFRYLFLTIGVFLILDKISKNKKKIFLYFNLILILLIGLDIIYQYVNDINIFGFEPGMCEKNFINCTRFSGVFKEELIAGSFLCQLGLIYFFLLNSLNLNKKYFYISLKIIFCSFLFFVILITGERNALLIFLICFFFFFYFKKKILNFFAISF